MAAIGWGIGKKKQSVREALEPVVVRVKQIFTPERLNRAAQVVVLGCVATSLWQGTKYAIRTSGSTEEMIGSIFAIWLAILGAYLAAHHFGLAITTDKPLNAVGMALIIFIGEGVSIYTSTASFYTQTLDTVSREVEQSAAQKQLSEINQGVINSANEGLAGLNSAPDDHITATKEARVEYAGMLSAARESVLFANDPNNFSNTQKSHNAMQDMFGVTPFQRAVLFALFLTAFPMIMNIFWGTVAGRRKLAIKMVDPKEETVKKT